MHDRSLYAAVLLLFFIGVGLLGWSRRGATQPGSPSSTTAQILCTIPGPPSAPPTLSASEEAPVQVARAPAQLPDLDAAAIPLLPIGSPDDKDQLAAPDRSPPAENVTQVVAWGKKKSNPPPTDDRPPPDPPEAESPPPDNPPAPPGGSDTIRPAAPANPPPGLHLEKIGPATVTLGKPFTYELVIRNPSPAALYQVRVEDEVPPGSNFLGADPKAEVQGNKLVWAISTIDPGMERRIKVELQPIRDGDIQTQATATFSTTSNLHIGVTQARLAVTKTGPSTAQVGDKMTFQIRVTNTGSGPATHVLIHDDLPPSLKHEQSASIEADIEVLAPGQTETLPLEVTAVLPGRFENEVVVTADDGLRASARCPYEITQPGLVLRKTGPKQISLNHAFECRLELQNTGTAPVTSLHVTDTLPEALEFANASDGGVYDSAARNIDWDVGMLPPGETRVVAVNLIGRTPGDWINQATAHADHGLESKAELPVHIAGDPGLHVEVTDLVDPVEEGAETGYEIRVVNQGTCACTSIKILALVPDGMEVLDASGPVDYRVEGQQLIFDPLPLLAGRADALYRIRVRGRKSGEWRLRLNMTSDQLDKPVVREESTRVYK